MIKIFFIYAFACLTLTLATNCTRIPLYTPTTNYKVKVLHRKVIIGNPSVFGRIESIYQNGNYQPIILAYVSAANQGTKSNEEGKYVLTVSPGKYNISVRCVGYQPALIKAVRITKSDSVMVDFHLVADTVKL